MKRVILFISILFFIANLTYSQDKQFTVKDIIFKAYPELLPENLSQLKWIPNSNAYSFVDKGKDTSALVKNYAEKDEQETIVILDSLNADLKANGLEEASRFPRIEWLSEDEFKFWKGNSLVTFNTGKQSLEVLNFVEKNALNKSTAPNNRYTAYTVDNNLFFSMEKDHKKQITFDENEGIVNGQEVHRREFGINTGIFWSPNSNYIAFYRKDETMVTDYPIVDLTNRPAQLQNAKYPMAGQQSHHVTIGVHNIASGSTVFLKTGEPKDQYLTSVTWGPNENFIYVAHLNRDQDHLRLVKYDIHTGSPVKTLFEEKDEEYVEPEHQLKFLPNEDDKFLWFSERDGWNHLYLFNTEGKLIRQLTEGEWVVNSFHGFDEKGENFFITATKESPVERHYYKVEVSSGDMERITKGQGIHNVQHNSNGTYFIDNFNSPNRPRTISVLNAAGQNGKEILNADNPYKDYNTGNIELFTTRNDEGTKLYGTTYYPPNFDASKKYPLIVYVYGGPHAQLVYNSFPKGRYDVWSMMMAQKGYLVMKIDNRGSANRGLEFEQEVHRQLGTKEVEDQLAGLNHLVEQGFVDTSRIGVFGWSYGGFMTTSLLLRGNGMYKVGVGGGAVIDWKYYEVMYTERYMDTPESNPEGYEKANLLNRIDNLKGKDLLLVHGTSDDVVVWQQTLRFVKKAASKNLPLDYYPYPGHKHGVGGRDALHLYNKITDYFLENL